MEAQSLIPGHNVPITQAGPAVSTPAAHPSQADNVRHGMLWLQHMAQTGNQSTTEPMHNLGQAIIQARARLRLSLHPYRAGSKMHTPLDLHAMHLKPQ